VFTLRFDLRAPGSGASAPDLYAAALDMCAWAESRGAILARSRSCVLEEETL